MRTGASSASSTSMAPSSTAHSRPSELLAALTRTSTEARGLASAPRTRRSTTSGRSSTTRCRTADEASGDAERSASAASAPGRVPAPALPSPDRRPRGDGVAMIAACQAASARGTGRISLCPISVWRCASSTPLWARWTATWSGSSSVWRASKRKGADVAAFPELAITGYPPEDLLLKPAFVAAQPRRPRQGGRGHVGVRRPRRFRGRGRRRGRRRRRRPRRGGRSRGARSRHQGRAAAPAQRRGRVCRGRGGRGVPQAPPAQLRRLRRGALVRAGDVRLGAVRGRWHPRRGVDLRGPVVRGRARLGPGGRGRAPRRERERVAVLGRAASRSARRAPGPGWRNRAVPSPTSTRSAARTSSSSTAGRSSWTPPAHVLAAAPRFVETLLLVDVAVDIPVASAPDRPVAARGGRE